MMSKTPGGAGKGNDLSTDLPQPVELHRGHLPYRLHTTVTKREIQFNNDVVNNTKLSKV